MSDAAPAPVSSSQPMRHSAATWAGALLLAVLFGLALYAYPPLKDASVKSSTPQWVGFFGRFHVIALHMPVGVLLLAALMEFCVIVRHRVAELLAPAITFVLVVGAWSAAISVVFGILLSRTQSFNNASFYAHQWLGVISGIGAVLMLVLKLISDSTGKIAWVYRGVFAVTLTVMGIGAHFGGNMVHESTYLTKYAPEWLRNLVEKSEGVILAKFEPEKKGGPAAPENKTPGAPANNGSSTPPVVVKVDGSKATVYAAFIAPILESKCNSCHNAEKSKGELRLDSHEFIMKGGSNGETVVVGDPTKSRLVSSLLLPSDDDDHMPPAKKPQPTKEEIAMISWWVKEGASKDLTVAAAKLPDELKGLAQTLLSSGKGGAAGGSPPVFLAMAEVNTAVAEAMKKINGTGASLAPLAADSKELRFTALNVAKDYGDANLKDLEPIAANIVALDLAKTKVTDAAVATIAKMTALRELHLENTAITDAGASQLKALTNLEYLNLYGSKVTDKTLKDIEGLAKLRALYVWQTGVTKPGVDAFKAKHPGATVNAGWTDADNAKVVAVAAAPAPAAKPEEKPAAKPAAPAPTPAKPEAKPAAVAATAAKGVNPNGIVYKDVVAPILAAKCNSCHGTEKSKGKLRLNTFANIMKGGSDGATTVIAGKPGDSLMIKRVCLPADDDDHMPPKDEKQMTKDEIALLRWWIEQGASETLTVAAAKKTPEIEGFLKTLAVAPAAEGPAKPEKPKAKPLTADEKKAVAEAAAKATALNASLMPVAQDTEELRFGCVNASDKFGDKEIGILVPVAAHIVWLDLARSKVTDAALATVGKMTALERLHLENTGVTDAGLAQLAGLKNVEYINLYGTKVTDAGIAKLAANKALKKLFVWQTAVTRDGAKKLEAAVPGLVVNVGLSEAEIAKLVQEAKPPEPAKPADTKKPADAKKPDAKPAVPPAKPDAKPAPKAEAKPAPAPAAPKPAAPAAPADKKPQ